MVLGPELASDDAGMGAAGYSGMVSAEQPGGRPPSGSRSRLARVLVIDDEVLLAHSLRLLLSNEFEVEATTQAEQALQWIAAGESYDVILCDVMMPGMNGVELRDKVESLVPEQAARIVFITGGLLIPQVRALIDRVPNTCLEKPLDLEGLRELIRRRVRHAWRTAAGAI
jgi:DNA-binding NtrC family response regulator